MHICVPLLLNESCEENDGDPTEIPIPLAGLIQSSLLEFVVLVNPVILFIEKLWRITKKIKTTIFGQYQKNVEIVCLRLYKI